MTQPNIPAPVSTAQRPINGAISGLFAQLVGNAGTAYLMAHGWDPGSATMAATAAGSAVSGTMATVGDWSRGVMAEGKAGPVGRLILMLASRIG